MKLSEALILRKDIQSRLRELNNRLYAQCVDSEAEDQRAAVAEARDWALLLIKGQRVVWQAKYDRQDAEVNPRMARMIVDKCVELCRQMGGQQ